MENNKKIEILEEIFEMEELKKDTILEELETWDSVAVLSIIAIIDSDFDKVYTASEIRECKTIGDLMNLME